MTNHGTKSCLVADQPILAGNTFDKHIFNQFDFDSCNWSSYDIIYVLAELKWDEKKRTDFYGVYLIQELRRLNINLPIVICSFVSRLHLIEKWKFEILRFKGHGFIQLPNETNITESDLIPLTEMEMFDVRFHFCELSGAISLIYHHKQKVGDNLDLTKEYLLQMLNEIKELPGIPSMITNIIDIDIDTVNKIKDQSNLDNFMALPVTHITSMLHNEKEVSSFTFNETVLVEGHWEILLLDDEPNSAVIQTLINAISMTGLKLHLANDVSHAKLIIENDLLNRITVVISDYRLEKSGEIKENQGYTFVQWLAKQPHINSIFILSGLDRYFVKKLFKAYEIKVHPENKNELSPTRLKDYLNDIIEAGNDEYNCILNMPTAGDWDPHLLAYYSHYRSLPNHANIEHSISLRAKRIINELDVFFSLRSTSRRNWFNNLLSEGPVISKGKKLTTRLFDEDTNIPLPVSKKTWNAFVEVLVYRRVALYLFNNKEMTRGFVSGLINRGKFINDTSQKLVFTRLGISQFDFPDYVLIEELNWFKLYLGIDPNNKNIITQESIVFFERIIHLIEVLLNSNFDLVIKHINALVATEQDNIGNVDSTLFSIVSENIQDSKNTIKSSKLASESDSTGKKKKLKIHCNTLKELAHIVEIINHWGIIPEGKIDYGTLINDILGDLRKQGILSFNN